MNISIDFPLQGYTYFYRSSREHLWIKNCPSTAFNLEKMKETFKELQQLALLKLRQSRSFSSCLRQVVFLIKFAKGNQNTIATLIRSFLVYPIIIQDKRKLPRKVLLQKEAHLTEQWNPNLRFPRKYLKYHLVWYSGFSSTGVLGEPNICKYISEYHSADLLVWRPYFCQSAARYYQLVYLPHLSPPGNHRFQSWSACLGLGRRLQAVATETSEDHVSF